MENKGKAFIHSADENRNVNDLYETPYSMTEQFLNSNIATQLLNNDYSYLEPACGNGAIEKILKKHFSNVTCYDIETNFLLEKNNYDFIVTNPPYKYADEFVEKAKEVSNIGFSFLLRTNYLSGVKRYNKGLYENLYNVTIFTRMPDLRAEIREDGKYPTAGIVYGWFTWLKDYNDLPTISWIDNNNYVLKKKDLE